MLVPVLLFIVGLLFLIKGGDWFVDGASALARRFHLPELLIGATVVSIGTTLPEVMVSTMSAVSGHGEIAYGNAIGSVICNSALIAAITIAVRPGKVDPKTLKTPVIFFFIAAAIYCVAAYGFGEFTRPMGFIMLAMFVAYMVANVRQMKNAPAEEHAEEEELIPLSKTLILLVAGAAVIAVGANLLVDNGTLIAQALGVPESVIALTFVALGTSLPELVTAITSLIKGHSDLSVGNVVGANVFNLVLVSGVSVTLAPFTIPQSSTLFGVNSSLVLDLPVMLAVMLIMTVLALVKGKMFKHLCCHQILDGQNFEHCLCRTAYLYDGAGSDSGFLPLYPQQPRGFHRGACPLQPDLDRLHRRGLRLLHPGAHVPDPHPRQIHRQGAHRPAGGHRWSDSADGHLRIHYRRL